MHIIKAARGPLAPVASKVSDAPILSHFEYSVVLGVLALGADAYAAELARHLTDALQRHVSVAQVFVSLTKLEAKKCVGSKLVFPEQPRKGDRRRKVFHVKAAGEQALRVTAAAYENQMPSALKKESSREETQQGDRAPQLVS
jgi:DNA-binding PadR family transcriptional regulator